MLAVRLERRVPAARARRRDLGGSPHAGDGAPRARPRASARRCSPRARARSQRLRTRTTRCSQCTIPRFSTSSARRGTSGRRSGLPSDRVVPYVFAREELTSGRPAPKPAAVWARPGRFAYDTMTLIGPGTWEAARGSGRRRADRRRARRGRRAGRIRVLPPARPSRDAIALRRLVLPEQLGGRSGGAPRRVGGPVAIVDIDAHHGNGTQELFRGRDDVRTASVHVDPGAGWFPHFLGFAARTTSRTSTCRSRPAPATSRGSPRCARRPRSRPERARSSSRSASTPPPPTRRARSQ